MEALVRHNSARDPSKALLEEPWKRCEGAHAETENAGGSTDRQSCSLPFKAWSWIAMTPPHHLLPRRDNGGLGREKRGILDAEIRH